MAMADYPIPWHWCSMCGQSQPVQPEPADRWEDGYMRPVKKLTRPELKAYRWLEGMPLTRYICTGCYHGMIQPRVALEARQEEGSRS